MRNNKFDNEAKPVSNMATVHFTKGDRQVSVPIPEHVVRQAFLDALDPKEKRLMWACDECGCTDVEESVWCNLNTGEKTGEVSDDIFCPQCEDETKCSRILTAPKPYVEERCNGCDRPSFECSQLPCLSVILDRGPSNLET